MDFLEQIRGLSDEELEKVVREKIEKLEASKPKEEPKQIGYIVEQNFTKNETFVEENMVLFELGINCFFAGYIKKGTKMVYGLSYDRYGNARCEGNYYYLDDEGYIYEFCKFIRDKDISNEYELFDYVQEFLRSYFGLIEDIPRPEMFQLIYKDKNTYFPPVREHSIRDFKGRGNALCTEYAATAQNILCVFGMESYLVIGNQKTDGTKGESHAFNIVSFDEKATGEEVNALVDFATPVNVYNIDYKILGVSPYIVYLDDFDQKFVDDFLYNNKRIKSEDYGYLMFGENMINIVYERDRCYYIDSVVKGDSKIKTKK